MQTSSLALIGILALPAASALALPFPVGTQIANFKHADALVLVDNDDMTRADFASGNYKVVHILPRRVEIFKDPETGKADFSTLPVYDRNGKIQNLILDFSVVTSTGNVAESKLASVFPSIATRYYPMAKSSSFAGTFQSEHAKILTLVDDSEGAPADFVLNAIGQAEPLRIDLSKEGLNQLRCAIDGFEAAQAEIADKGLDPVDFPSALSLITGRLNQSYRVMDYEQKLIGVNAITDFRHSILLTAKADPTDSARELDGLIAKAIKFYKPTCDWKPNVPAEDQIKLAGFKEFIIYIGQYSITFKLKYSH
ncbi:MAG TPA: hypothetical protein VE954_18585 [Oligoflexus sp.]|uniref:hypothetical protein n=1 Tax=Oligoflexus sp. TaxID=1971216 RepID=UPI002D3FB82D|nr:hypothetical protein [Oligoflexus sp.]HYX35108.1 hypothetical protein [Oligoflexus sp.]